MCTIANVHNNYESSLMILMMVIIGKALSTPEVLKPQPKHRTRIFLSRGHGCLNMLVSRFTLVSSSPLKGQQVGVLGCASHLVGGF